MFRGITPVTIDIKGRMAIPVRSRELLLTRHTQVVVTIDTESPCLLLYPFFEWEIIEQKLAGLPSFNPAARRIQRLLIGHATEVDVDASGRILLPPVLRDYASLTKKALFVGQGKKFEIWDEDSWQAARTEWISGDLTTELPVELTEMAL